MFLINRIPTKILNDMSSYEVLYGDASDLNMVNTFGCLCYSSNVQPQKTKFDPIANQIVFLGFKQGMKRYITLNVTKNLEFIC